MNKLVNLRLNDSLIEKIDDIVTRGIYSNRTEFIKHSLITTINDFETKEAINRLKSNSGFAKKAGIKEPTNEEMKTIRENLGKDLLKKYNLN
ncbi:MAG: ribbon-helix-helix domain-containing protein [Candidatus ainarchaeum sp.]|nr:ribbon-helix-helix domain-containing protein [Candidatus ainarchaeum sp.]